MPETASLEAHEATPRPARRDVRVVTQEQLLELRREQQEIYQSLRLNGSGPSDAARQIGIPRSLADEWERSGADGAASTPAATDLSASPPAPTPASAGTNAESADSPRVVCLDGDTGDLARQARECAQRLEREMATLRRLLQRLAAATAAAPASSGTRAVTSAGTPPDTTGIPSRAARSSLTAVLLARGRARQHPAPLPRA